MSLAAAAAPLSSLRARFRRTPTSLVTIGLCDALRAGDAVDAHELDEIGAVIARRFAADMRVHLAFARLLIAAGDLRRAHDHCARAAELAPWASGPLRLLGEVLLRFGDAERACAAFDSATALAAGGADTFPIDEDLAGWRSRAYALRETQEREGEGAVVDTMRARTPETSQVRLRAVKIDDPHSAPTRALRPPAALLDQLRTTEDAVIETARPPRNPRR
jgi:hypothetical protein